MRPFALVCIVTDIAFTKVKYFNSLILKKKLVIFIFHPLDLEQKLFYFHYTHIIKHAFYLSIRRI